MVMVTKFFAHAGEVHKTAIDATQHTASDPKIMWLVLILMPFMIFLIARRIFKLKIDVTLLLISLFLICFSVYSYHSPGIYTALSLIFGFTIVFLQTFFGLSKKD